MDQVIEGQVDDAYLAYVERRRARTVEEIVVYSTLTEHEAKLLVELVDLTAPQLRKEQALVLRSAATKVELALVRAREGKPVKPPAPPLDPSNRG